MNTVTLVTGGFDPLHSGHIAYFKAAKEFGNPLCVGVNSDDWLTRKKGKPFMSISERMSIIKELKCVDIAIEFIDKDDSATIHGLIAQEVKAAMDKVGNSTFNGWEDTVDGQAVSREMFITPLIKAVQELSAKVKALEEA